jgi:hypothetical protein
MSALDMSIMHIVRSATLLGVAPSSKEVSASVHEADGRECERFPNYRHPLERGLNNVKMA